MNTHPILTTERLLLRRVELSDAPAMLPLVSAYEIAEQTLMIPHPYPPEAVEPWIAAHAEKLAAGDEAPFAITLRDGGTFIGTMGLMLTRDQDRAELGYWIGKPYWNRGYASEAAVAVIRYGFEQLGLHRIFASHFSRNPASGRVLQKAGMQHEGTQRGHFKKWGEYLDAELYAVLNPHAAPAPPASR